jgi:succinoglycan biosynthesis protein ExoA
MPFLNEATHLPAVLATIEAQTIPRERLFLIAVDNGSSDDGPAIVTAWLARLGMPGRLVRAETRSIPFALNRGLAEADDGDIVVRLDAHTLYDPAYLATIADAFETLGPEAWCVGGAPTPAPSSDFSSALGEALYSNPMGLGPADYRNSAATRRVSTVYLGAWRPGVLQRLGGFDERWLANEDCELTERIAAAGGTVMRIPVRCGRISTRGPASTVRQWSRYGFWRAQTFKQYPAAIRPRHVAVPMALVLALALLVSPIRLALVPLYVVYALATIALRRRGERPLVTAASLAFFPFVHIGYALGLIAGALGTPATLRGPANAQRRNVPQPLDRIAKT